VLVITFGQLREIGSVLKLISKVENRPKLLSNGFIFTEVRILRRRSKKARPETRKLRRFSRNFYYFWIVLFVNELVFVLFQA
jgi:hypothetical protein